MSANEERVSRRRPILIGAAAIAVAALAVGVIVLVNVLSPERVDPSSVEITPQPQQVAAGDVVAAPVDADLTAIVDVSAELAQGFAGDVVDVRSRVNDGQEPAPEVIIDDECLLAWAKENLAALAVSGAYEVVTVCDRPTAVLAGPAGADSKVLVYGALEDSAPDGIRGLIAETSSERVAFVAVRSADGKAQLLATSELPDTE